jgi:hypothetical protein
MGTKQLEHLYDELSRLYVALRIAQRKTAKPGNNYRDPQAILPLSCAILGNVVEGRGKCHTRARRTQPSWPWVFLQQTVKIAMTQAQRNMQYPNQP